MDNSRALLSYISWFRSMMTQFSRHPARDLGYSLLGPDYLPIGEAEMALRDAAAPPRNYRALKSGEIEHLVQHGSFSPDWGSVLVADPFHPHFVQRCRFYGTVRLGGFESIVLTTEDIRLPVGLFDSTIVSCDIGRNAVIDRVAYLAHTIVGDEAILLNIGSVTTTVRAAFGNGVQLDISNENGGRSIQAFAGMRIADTWLMSRHREDAPLMQALRALTASTFQAEPGRYSQIGERAAIVNTAAIQDVMIGPHARVTGASRIENATLLSDEAEPCSIADRAVAQNGILGYGARIGAGVKARNFVLGTRARLEDGARCFHTVLGDNSTIACCEVLNNLVFPFHEQHHNNSFMIATTVLGQSNIAAGVTLGSNHNSRSPDGEVLAGRGFWPGLCADFKHNCRFAAWTLLGKGSYPAEINLTIPFCLVTPGGANEGLQITPAWWFLHNMYALERSRWKFKDRDKRIHADQAIESDPLAPDTVEEILHALDRLESWTGRAALAREGSLVGRDIADEAAQARGRELLLAGPAALEGLEILVDGIENSRRPARILKAAEAWAMFRELVHHYAVSILIGELDRAGATTFDSLAGLFASHRERRWFNLGGQLVPGEAYDALRRNIASGAFASWLSVHTEYDRLQADYPEARARHAAAALLALEGVAPGQLGGDIWKTWLGRAAATQQKIAQLVRASRARDHANPFRFITFDNPAEMDAVLGTIDDNAFIRRIDEQTAAFERRVTELLRV